METFTKPKPLEENPLFQSQKKTALSGLKDEMIDAPIIEIVRRFNTLPYAFTLQCCYGHFLCRETDDPHNFDPVPVTAGIEKVEYRIAYIAFCVDNSSSGKSFLDALGRLVQIDPENIQFCSAKWFWKRQVNSYALQVEPDRMKDKDVASLDFTEASKIEKVRDRFFIELGILLKGEIGRINT